MTTLTGIGLADTFSIDFGSSTELPGPIYKGTAFDPASVPRPPIDTSVLGVDGVFVVPRPAGDTPGFGFPGEKDPFGDLLSSLDGDDVSGLDGYIEGLSGGTESSGIRPIPTGHDGRPGTFVGIDKGSLPGVWLYGYQVNINDSRGQTIGTKVVWVRMPAGETYKQRTARASAEHDKQHALQAAAAATAKVVAALNAALASDVSEVDQATLNAFAAAANSLVAGLGKPKTTDDPNNDGTSATRVHGGFGARPTDPLVAHVRLRSPASDPAVESDHGTAGGSVEILDPWSDEGYRQVHARVAGRSGANPLHYASDNGSMNPVPR